MYLEEKYTNNGLVLNVEFVENGDNNFDKETHTLVLNIIEGLDTDWFIKVFEPELESSKYRKLVFNGNDEYANTIIWWLMNHVHYSMKFETDGVNDISKYFLNFLNKGYKNTHRFDW